MVSARGSWLWRAAASAALPFALACGGGDDGGTGPGRSAAALSVRGGDNQTAEAGAPVSVAPSVFVTDAAGAPVANVVVTFAVASGGGTLTGAQATSDASGAATLGGWTLGAAPGENTLRATAPGVPGAVTFRATATLPDVCAVRQPFTLAAGASGVLATTDCLLNVGAYVDFHGTTLPAGASLRFTMTSSAVDALLTFVTSDGVPVAVNDDATDTETTASFRVIARAGSYVLGATSFERGEVGPYTLASTPVSTDVARCEEVFITPGVSTAQALQPTDCASPADASGARLYSDQYLIWLQAGRAYTLELTSTAFDAYLRLVGPDNATVAQNDNATATGRDARIAFTPTRSGFHLIDAGAAARASTGAYVLGIQ
jgi:hypothetical protein